MIFAQTEVKYVPFDPLDDVPADMPVSVQPAEIIAEWDEIPEPADKEVCLSNTWDSSSCTSWWIIKTT